MSLETIHEAAKLLSNGLALPVLLLSLGVVLVWYEPAKKTISNFIKTPEQWFILGVFFGFVGEFLDNLYWTVTWTASYLNTEYASSLMKYGVFPNIPFRQGLGIVAAYCHIRSAMEYKKEFNKLEKESNKKIIYIINLLLIISIALGLVFSGILLHIKQ